MSEQAALFAMALNTDTGAEFSECKRYRYTLWRRWANDKAFLVFLMLNPSTADEVKNDPTVERCQRRAISGGYGGLVVLNLFALRSTDPKALYDDTVDPVGPRNDMTIVTVGQQYGSVICGWGEHGAMLGRGAHVKNILRTAGVKLFALRLNKSGEPAHPLYIPYSASPFQIGGE